MSITEILAAIKAALGIVRAVIQTGQDAAPFIKVIMKVLSKNDISADDLAAMRTEIAALEAELDAPLPAPEPGEAE